MLIISNSGTATVAGRAAVCTTLSACGGGIACLVNAFRRHKAWDLVCLCNGVLVGFVSVTANCHVIEPWAAILVGAVGGLVSRWSLLAPQSPPPPPSAKRCTCRPPLTAPCWMACVANAQIFDGVCWVFLKLRIDDPLSAAPMHGFGGMWGVFFTGLLAKQEYVEQAYGRSPYYGVFYGSKGNLLASQCVGILAIVGWTCGLTGALFFVLKRIGQLRISEEDEHRGLDASKHGGSAYNTNAQQAGGTRTVGVTPKEMGRDGLPIVS